MAKTWVLRTDTKGTGANVVPLDRITQRPTPEPLSVPSKPQPRPAEEPQPRAPLRFRVVDVMTRQNLVDNAGAAETIDVLKDVRSTVDVNLYAWRPEEGRWQLLSLAEQRAMLDLAASRRGAAG
jgi:hypothetical protein